MIAKAWLKRADSKKWSKLNPDPFDMHCACRTFAVLDLILISGLRRWEFKCGDEISLHCLQAHR